MSVENVVHSTFVIERTYAAPVGRVFAAFADPGKKRRWFAEGEGWQVQSFTLDFRAGGRESSSFLFHGDPSHPMAGQVMRNETVFQDIVPERRIVFAYTMGIGERPFSASLVTVELLPAGQGTTLRFTEQAAFFERSDGAAQREGGWRQLLQRIDAELAR
jgi:uncharacterized protein YndB with AHSA1/START domain